MMERREKYVMECIDEQYKIECNLVKKTLLEVGDYDTVKSGKLEVVSQLDASIWNLFGYASKLTGINYSAAAETLRIEYYEPYTELRMKVLETSVLSTLEKAYKMLKLILAENCLIN